MGVGRLSVHLQRKFKQRPGEKVSTRHGTIIPNDLKTQKTTIQTIMCIYMFQGSTHPPSPHAMVSSPPPTPPVGCDMWWYWSPHPPCGISVVDGVAGWTKRISKWIQNMKSKETILGSRWIKISRLFSSHAWHEQAHGLELCKERLDIFIAIYNGFDAWWYISFLL